MTSTVVLLPQHPRVLQLLQALDLLLCAEQLLFCVHLGSLCVLAARLLCAQSLLKLDALGVQCLAQLLRDVNELLVLLSLALELLVKDVDPVDHVALVLLDTANTDLCLMHGLARTAELVLHVALLLQRHLQAGLEVLQVALLDTVRRLHGLALLLQTDQLHLHLATHLLLLALEATDLVEQLLDLSLKAELALLVAHGLVGVGLLLLGQGRRKSLALLIHLEHCLLKLALAHGSKLLEAAHLQCHLGNLVLSALHGHLERLALGLRLANLLSKALVVCLQASTLVLAHHQALVSLLPLLHRHHFGIDFIAEALLELEALLLQLAQTQVQLVPVLLLLLKAGLQLAHHTLLTRLNLNTTSLLNLELLEELAVLAVGIIQGRVGITELLLSSTKEFAQTLHVNFVLLHLKLERVKLVHLDVVATVLFLLQFKAQILKLFLRQTQRLTELLKLLLVNLRLCFQRAKGSTQSGNLILKSGDLTAKATQLVLNTGPAHQRHTVKLVTTAETKVNVCADFADDQRTEQRQRLAHNITAINGNDNITRLHRSINVCGTSLDNSLHGNNTFLLKEEQAHAGLARSELGTVAFNE
mmetsp:Transcript_27058/g.62383  ORF Transcript_27058/g.62383 Transcript_27058/m.62383 type:complete len:587 (-) Transcript_27058:70-1830(-)